MEMSSSGDEDGMDNHGPRGGPNILITGTPGTGKTTTCDLIVDMTHMRYFNVGDVVKQHHLYEGYDPVFNAMLLDEDRVVDHLEHHQQHGHMLLDHHGCDFFPERWFDAVVVLTCDNTVLWDRLSARGYDEQKVQENVECEIMQVVEQEARESYPENVVHVLKSENTQHLQQNASYVANLYRKLLKEKYGK